MKRVLSLKSNASFSYIRRRGRRVESKYMALRYVPAGSLKIGISVSKKLGNAVKRNLLKRRIKEIFVSVSAQLKKYNLVVTLRDPILELSYAEMKDDFTALLKKADIFIENEVSYKEDSDLL